jgi:hypothetical protein
MKAFKNPEAVKEVGTPAPPVTPHVRRDARQARTHRSWLFWASDVLIGLCLLLVLLLSWQVPGREPPGGATSFGTGVMLVTFCAALYLLGCQSGRLRAARRFEQFEQDLARSRQQVARIRKAARRYMRQVLHVCDAAEELALSRRDEANRNFYVNLLQEIHGLRAEAERRLRLKAKTPGAEDAPGHVVFVRTPLDRLRSTFTGQPRMFVVDQDVAGTPSPEAASPSVPHPGRRPFTGFDRERAAWERLKPELLRTAEGRFFVLVGDEMVGPLERHEDAERAGYARFGLGPLYVKQVLAEEPVAEVSRYFAS